MEQTTKHVKDMCITEKRVKEVLEVQLSPMNNSIENMAKSVEGINESFKELNGTVKTSRDRIRDLEEKSSHRKDNCPFGSLIEGLVATDLASKAVKVQLDTDEKRDWALLDIRTKRQEIRMYILGLFITVITVLSNWLIG